MDFVPRKATYRLYPNATGLAALKEAHGLHSRVTNALHEEHKRRHEAIEKSFSFAATCRGITACRERSSGI